MKTADFANAQAGLESPGIGSFPITPSDSTTIAARSLYVTSAGDVCFVGVDGTTDTWTVPDNFIIPIAVTKVKASGTTGGAGATGIHGIA
jgi:hypothetical protein